MTDNESIPPLTSYKDLPREGSKTFRIHDDLVTFDAVRDDGKLRLWVVETTDPNYGGLLTYGTTTFGGEHAMEYAFKATGPGMINVGPTLVNVTELRQMFFGEPHPIEE